MIFTKITWANDKVYEQTKYVSINRLKIVLGNKIEFKKYDMFSRFASLSALWRLNLFECK